MGVTVSVRAGLPADERVWSELAAASTNVFLTPEWARTWWTHFGRGRDAVTLELGTEALLVGCVSGPPRMRTLRLLGHGPADELGVAVDPTRRAETARIFGRALRDVEDCDVFVGEQLAGDVDWPSAVEARVIARISSPVIELLGGWDAYLATRSSHFRTQLRRIRRDMGSVEIRCATEPDRLDSDLDAFFALHRRRHGSGNAFSSPAGEAFHRDFARAAFARGWLALWLLESEGRAVAGIYALRFGGAVSMYQSAALADGPRSAGTALLAHVVEETANAGLAEYRFLRGGEDYKLRWATRDDGLQTVAAGLSAGGRVLASLAGCGLSPRRAVVRRTAGRAVRRALLA